MSGNDRARDAHFQDLCGYLEPYAGTFTADKLLGTGGMGSVVRARTSLGRYRALKFVHVHLLQHSEIFDRFRREAVVMTQIEHPNVGRVFNLHMNQGRPFIEMEYISGGSLSERLEREGCPPPRQAVKITLAIAKGLAAAHARGVIHRDVKPDNILLTPEGEIKVVDFGVAHVTESTSLQTRAGSVMGTYVFMSPQQAEGKKADVRDDVHALGVTFFTMLVPNALDPRIQFFTDILQKHLSVLEELPSEVVTVLRRATAIHVDPPTSDPEASLDQLRYANMAAFIHALEHLLEVLPEDPTPEIPLHMEGEPDEAPKHATIVPTPSAFADPEEDAPLSGAAPFDSIAHPAMDDHDAPAMATYMGSVSDFADHSPDTDQPSSRMPLILTAIGSTLVLAVAGWFAFQPDAPVEAPVVEPEPVVMVAPPESVMESPMEPDPEPVEVVPEPEADPEPPKAKVKKKAKVRAPAPEAAPETGAVKLILKSGTVATVRLSGAGGEHTLRGGMKDVPLGTYAVTVNLEGRDSPLTGTISVTKGLTTISCDKLFASCTGI